MKLPDKPILRALNRDDEQECNLVLAGWMRTYIDQSRGVEQAVFARLYKPVVVQLFERSTIMVACLHDAPESVIGWAAWEDDVLHYVTVKPRWQRLGVASWLLQDFKEMPVTYSHITSDGKKLIRHLGATDTWVYRPLTRFKEAA